MKIFLFLRISLGLALCLILFSGCASVQRTKYIKTTESLDTPHTILLAERSPEIVSINGEPLEPNTVSTRMNDFMTTGKLTYEIRVPLGECQVKAFFPQNGGGGAIGGYMRQNAPIYPFIAESGVVYRAIADPPQGKFAYQNMFKKPPRVQIIEEITGKIVTINDE